MTEPPGLKAGAILAYPYKNESNINSSILKMKFIYLLEGARWEKFRRDAVT